MAEVYQYHDRDVIAPEVYGRAGHPLEAFAWHIELAGKPELKPVD